MLNTQPVSPPRADAGPLRVMVVDDSAVIRGIICRLLEADAGIEVVASVSNGEAAITALRRHDAEVVVLDIEMPVMDGMTALPKLLAVDPTLKIIMASTLTKRNAAISLKALSAGAADYIPKPGSAKEIGGADDFQRDLLAKVRALGNARRGIELGAAYKAPSARASSADPKADGADPVLRPLPSHAPEILFIASSTGGPQALFTMLAELTKNVDIPILITQHMPPAFTALLAEHLKKLTGWASAEAVDGEAIAKQHIYIAPGDRHMLVRREGGRSVIRLDDSPPVNYCRPAADPMLASAAEIYGRRALAVVLTGMGQDGLRGCEALVAAGGGVVAQDKGTSVVWGMPGAVAGAGLCCAIRPLSAIAAQIQSIINRRSS